MARSSQRWNPAVSGQKREEQKKIKLDSLPRRLNAFEIKLNMLRVKTSTYKVQLENLRQISFRIMFCFRKMLYSELNFALKCKKVTNI